MAQMQPIDRKIIDTLPIDYLYIVKDHVKYAVMKKQLKNQNIWKQVFENGTVEIYKRR
jgi:hypothetical protein